MLAGESRSLNSGIESVLPLLLGGILDLKDVEANWNGLGRTDPMWAILSDPDHKGNKWRTEDFFRTGVEHVDQVMDYLQSLGMVQKRTRALDFGCGIGRLTQALATHFEEVIGVDISASMLELAAKYNRHGERCKYHLNSSADLSLFPDDSFDLVYSFITLQHMEARYAGKYIREFIRVLAPGGTLLFQVPSEPKSLSLKAKWFIKLYFPVVGALALRIRYGAGNIIEMHGIAKRKVIQLLEEGNVEIIGIQQLDNPTWLNFSYCARKR